MSVVFSRIGTELLHIMSAFTEASEQFAYALEPGLLPELSWPSIAPLDCGNGNDVAVDTVLARIVNLERVTVVFNPPAGTRLGPGTHMLKATAADSKYNGLSAECTVTVNLLNPRLSWPQPKAVTWTAGGYDFSATVAATVVNPRGVALAFDPPPSKTLPPGRHPLKVRAADETMYLQTEISVVLSVEKASATVKVVLPASVDWTPGGYELPKKVADTVPPDLLLDVKPGKKLQPGKYQLRATIAESEPYTGFDQADFTVERIKAPVTWKLPPSIVAEGSTLLLTEELLKSWVDNPQNIDLVFKPAAGEKLAPDTWEMSAHPVDIKNYLPTPATGKLIVMGTPRLDWRKLQPVDYERGGFALTADVLASMLNNPDGLELEFEPPVDTKLPLEEHKLKVRPKDVARWKGTWIPATLQVRKPKVSITWKPADLPWMPDGVDLGQATLNAQVSPPWAKVRYEPDVGDSLDEPGENTLYLHVVDPHCEPATFKTTVKLTTTKEQRNQLKVQASKAKEGSKVVKQKARVPSAKTLLLREQAYQDLLLQTIPPSQLTNEYPYGAANVTPHIHQYGNDHHLKTAEGDRIDLVQQGKRYEANIRDALDYALEFDRRNARGSSPTRLHAILTALLK